MKQFNRKKENFVCENCGEKVKGNGYTNHCPNCLWSKHVDINPGDRQEECKGLMVPVDLEKQGQDYVIIHKCQKCGAIRRIKTTENDNFDAILQLAKQQVNKLKKI
jgi:rubrerythrin